MIAQNFLSQINYEGHHYQVLTEVTDHMRYDSTIIEVNGVIKDSNGNLHLKRRTHSCKLLVEWRDESVVWVPVKDI